MKSKILIGAAVLVFGASAAYAADKCCCDKDKAMPTMNAPAPAPAPVPHH